MDILIVEDQSSKADSTEREIREVDPSINVALAADPVSALKYLRSQTFDVVVTDILFRPLQEEYWPKVQTGRISPVKDNTFLLSGLRVLSDAVRQGSRPQDRRGHRNLKHPGLVVWTSMDANRQLHVIYAHEKLQVRSFCSKDAPTRRGPKTGSLLDAIWAAYDNRPYDDSVMNFFLPKSTQSIQTSLFRHPRWCSLWRAYALGATSDEAIGEMLNSNLKTFRDSRGDMLSALNELAPQPNFGQPVSILGAFAQRYWEFFLDDTVMRRFPPENHPWANYRNYADD